jgi:hypothetical protein
MPCGRDPDPDVVPSPARILPELLAGVIVEDDSNITAGDSRFCEPLKAFVDDILPESLPAESLGDCKMREGATPAIVPAHHGGIRLVPELRQADSDACLSQRPSFRRHYESTGSSTSNSGEPATAG